MSQEQLSPNRTEKVNPPNLENLTREPIFDYSKNGFPLLYQYIERTGSPSSIYPLLGIKSEEFCVRCTEDGEVKFVTIETIPSERLAANEIRGVSMLHGGIAATYIDACSGALANLLDPQKAASTTEHRTMKYKAPIKVKESVLVASRLDSYVDGDKKRRPIVISEIFQNGILCVSAETELALLPAKIKS
jgi:acyl-coenzyme A thioesterase PaaI-like protein